MSRLEEAWVRGLDSGVWRTFSGSAALRRVRGGRPFRAADMVRRDVLSRIRSQRVGDRYEEVSVLCPMIGHMKSGGTMLGALLDAHPDAVFADEVDVVRYFSDGFSPGQIYSLLEKGARREAMKGRVTARRLEAYSFEVTGQSQGRSDRPRVIGDSKAGITTQRLGADPELLPRIQEALGDTELRFLQVVRNPFDPISVMLRRGKRTLDGAVERYFANCEILDDLSIRLSPSNLHVVHYEDMVDDPAAVLKRVCGFVGIEASDDYIAACSAVVRRRAPERTRVGWETDSVRLIEHRLSRYRFLDGYSFDDHGRST